MWIDKTARELSKGDTLLSTGAVVQQAVICGHGTKVYLHVEFEDGYTQTVTTDADTIIPIHVKDERTTNHD